MKTLELIKKIKIDFTKCHVDTDQWCSGYHEFEMSPKEFLSFSKQDFKSNDRKGNINALTNAKRAIDCQTEKIFFSIGLDPNNFSDDVIEEFIIRSKNSAKKDLPIRLRLLQAINFAPAKIIANVRQVRNILEHYYKAPSTEEVSDAIELAELFIQATDSRLKTMVEFGLTDEAKSLAANQTMNNSIWFHYKYEEKAFEVFGYVEDVRQKRFYLKSDCVEFLFLIKISTSFDYPEDVKDAILDWVDFIGHPIPRKNMNFVYISST